MFGSVASSAASTTNVDTTTKSQLAKNKLDKDLNQFLTLLVTQLQNQDPLKPMDANQFTSQLVQFASVEQQIYQNANLEKLVGMQQTSQVSSMVNYLGTSIEANGAAFNLDLSKAKFSYDLESRAVESTLTIQDSAGKTVFTIAADTNPGKQIYNWDGIQSDGTLAADGPYIAVISAKDRNGDLINVKQSVYGNVTGAGADKGQVKLFMGAVEASLEDVLNVSPAK